VKAMEAIGRVGERSPATERFSRAPWTDFARTHVGALCGAFFFILLPLLGPFLIVEYLFGIYHPHPITVDGTYFPDGGFLFDLHVLWKAGHNIATGHAPYPFVYPAPAAIFMVPFGALPWKVAVVAFALVLIGAAILTLRILGVRDWRCYAVALGALPGTSAVTLGAFSWLLALCAAAAWRYRDRRIVVALAIASAVVSKLFLWPLVIWLVATRRFRTATTTVVLGIVLVFGCWAMIGFDGMLDYPHHLGNVAGLEQARSYSPLALMRSVGMSSATARAALFLLTVVAIAAIIVVARRPDGDRRAFVWSVGAALLLSPIVWVHYLVLLYVVIALYRPRLSIAWMIPLLYWFLPGQDSHRSTAAILSAYAITALAFGATWYRRRGPATAPALSPR